MADARMTLLHGGNRAVVGDTVTAVCSLYDVTWTFQVTHVISAIVRNSAVVSATDAQTGAALPEYVDCTAPVPDGAYDYALAAAYADGYRQVYFPLEESEYMEYYRGGELLAGLTACSSADTEDTDAESVPDGQDIGEVSPDDAAAWPERLREDE